MGVVTRRVVRTYLEERETLVPHKKLVDIFNLDLLDLDFLSFSQPRIPILDNVTPADAVEVVAQSSWAHGLAEGVCGPSYAGLTPGTPEHSNCVYNVSHRVAASVLGISWPLPPPPTLPTARPPRRAR